LLRRIQVGFSLLEITVVLAIVGILGSTVGLLLMRQQRFYRGTSELIATRQSVRDAIDVFTTDVRGMSIADTARLLTDSAMEFFSTGGSSVVCEVAAPSVVGLAPASPSASTLTSFATQPDSGDLAVFYVDSPPPTPRWYRYRIIAFNARAVSTTCPASSGFASDADVAGGAKAYAVSLDAPLAAAVRPGSPVRFIRRGRYSLYRAADGEWYLGYRRCNAIGTSVCGSIQPLSGPYQSYSADAKQSGLVLEYFDRAGSDARSAPLSLARVDVTARAVSRQSLLVEGRRWTPSDSAHVSVALRNRL
jgi:prepilin-type N-terminal cleavage/methylation domain-containing protein